MIEAIKKIDDWQNKSAEEILAILQADTRHVRDVKATGGAIAKGEFDLLHVLAARLEIIRIGTSAQWKGPLVNAFDAMDDANPLKIGFELLLSNLQITGRSVFCHSNPSTGALVTGITEVAKSLGDAAWAARVQTEIDNLTGGVMYADITKEMITAAIARDKIEDVWHAKRAVVEDGIADGSIVTTQDIVNAIGGGSISD